MTQTVVSYNASPISVARVADGVTQAVGSFLSDAIPVANAAAYSVFAVLTGTFTGDIYVEARTRQSDSDSTEWFLISTSYSALTNSSEALFDASIFAYTHIRVGVTVATGSAVLDIDVSVSRR